MRALSLEHGQDILRPQVEDVEVIKEKPPTCKSGETLALYRMRDGRVLAFMRGPWKNGERKYYWGLYERVEVV